MGNGRMEGREVLSSVARTRGCIIILWDTHSKIGRLMAVRVLRDVKPGRWMLRRFGSENGHRKKYRVLGTRKSCDFIQVLDPYSKI